MPVNVDELIKSFEASRRAQAQGAKYNKQLDVAKYILNKAQVNFDSLKNMKDVATKRDSSGPSVISRIFDILSRPNYAVANAFQKDLDLDPTNDNVLENLWRGLAGYDKTTFSDVISTANQSTGGSDEDLSKLGKYGGGFVLDVLLDPTTYIGPGAIKAVGKAIGIGTKSSETGTAVSKPFNLTVNEIPREVDVTPTSAQHFNLATRPNDIDTVPTPLPNIFDSITTKATDVDIPIISKTPEVTSTLENIDKVSRNMARQRFRAEFTADLKAKLPDASPDEIKEKVTAWMDEYFPKARTTKFKEQTPGFPKFTPTPPVTQTVMKADDILDKIQKGDIATAENQAFNIEHRKELLAQIGSAGASETSQAIKYADGYADKILSKPNKFAKDPNKSPAVFNPAQQANLAETFMRIQKQTKGKLNAFRMIRASEDHLISRGYHPSFWDGTHVRLSDIVLEMAHKAEDIPNITKTYLTKIITDFKNSHKPGKNADFRIAQTIENLRASSAANDAPLVSNVIDKSTKTASIADKVLSDPKYSEFVKAVKEQANKNLNVLGSSHSAIKAANSLLDAVLNKNNANPALKATQAKRSYINSYMQGEERLWKPVQEAQTRAVGEIVGIAASSAAKEIGEGNKAVDFIMTRMATWWGQKDLRPEVLIKTSTAFANAGARARVWNKIAKDYTPEELEEGFKFAQNKIPLGAATDKIEKAGQIFQKSMQNLFDSTGLTKEALMASSVATRSGMLLDDINYQLSLIKAPFRFTNGRFIDPQGNLKDYSQGIDWLKSWEMFDVKDPLELMWKVETAVEQLMHKYAYLDEVAARWGSPVKTSEFNTLLRSNAGGTDSSIFGLPSGYARASKAKDPKPLKARTKVKGHRLDGLYFPSDIAPQIKKSLDSWDQIYDPKSNLVKLFDRVTRAWKSGVTIYAPSHHIRNLIGDVYLSWMAGVSNPLTYGKAAKVIWSQKDRYRDLESVENLIGRDALSKAMTRPGDVVAKTRGGHKLTAEQIYIAAHSHGLLPTTNVIEELFGEPLLKFQPFKGRVRDFVRGTSENREHFVRITHFIDILEKSKEKNLQTLFKEASKTVRKWHPDGSDLTDFERNTLRRIMPFYSWTRKSIPLLVESALLNPGKTVLYPKFMQAMQGMMGIEAPSRTDPFPYDQLFPDWIKEKGIGPTLRHGLTESGVPGLLTNASRSITGFTGEDAGYTVVNPSNPFIDMVAQFGGMGNPSDPIQGVGQMLTPFFKIPSEIIHNKTSLTGAPIEPGKYIAENIPIASMFSRVSGIGAFGPTERGMKEGINYEALVNLLTALGLQGTGPYIKTAEFQERDRRREQ
jgi:hypothetical protein